MTLLRYALAALFACALAISADARSPQGGGDRGGQGHGDRGGQGHGGHGHGGKGGDRDTPAPQAPEPPAADTGPAGAPGAGDGSGADARGHFRLFCDRWKSDYWCQPGAPYVLPPK